MGLAEKMFSRSEKTCTIRSECKVTSDRQFFDDLFSNTWEVFVIRRDERTGRHDWFTQCCETATARYEKPNILSATCS